MIDEETRYLVAATAEKLLTDLVNRPISDAWPLIAENGLHLVLVPEAAGGLALGGEIAAAIIAHAASLSIMIPIGETIVANLLMARAGIESDDRIATLVGRVTDRVPWARHAAHVVIESIDPGKMIVVNDDAIVITDTGNSLTGAPRDSVSDFGNAAKHELPGGTGAVERCGAALRIIEMAGAARTILSLTVEYVCMRRQFGRPLSKFQAIQQELARMAGQVAVLDGAAGIACAFLDGPLGPSLELAAAKARANEAAGLIAAIAHQAHGAIGFTDEYRLGRLTKSLWSSRSEFGGAAYWQDWIADYVLADSAEELWPMIVAA
ncbi:acyl-CoA dehydrogenase family protein [Novosphingopyxis sp.]|uniref:acyl-CoA dehydrogenase family protein n=1 Tax=Novosphingopyxis sp. TaxID=2709690 RepID=UPI003B5B0694